MTALIVHVAQCKFFYYNMAKGSRRGEDYESADDLSDDERTYRDTYENSEEYISLSNEYLTLDKAKDLPEDDEDEEFFGKKKAAVESDEEETVARNAWGNDSRNFYDHSAESEVGSEDEDDEALEARLQEARQIRLDQMALMRSAGSSTLADFKIATGSQDTGKQEVASVVDESIALDVLLGNLSRNKETQPSEETSKVEAEAVEEFCANFDDLLEPAILESVPYLKIMQGPNADKLRLAPHAKGLLELQLGITLWYGLVIKAVRCEPCPAVLAQCEKVAKARKRLLRWREKIGEEKLHLLRITLEGIVSMDVQDSAEDNSDDVKSIMAQVYGDNDSTAGDDDELDDDLAEEDHDENLDDDDDDEEINRADGSSLLKKALKVLQMRKEHEFASKKAQLASIVSSYEGFGTQKLKRNLTAAKEGQSEHEIERQRKTAARAITQISREASSRADKAQKEFDAMRGVKAVREVGKASRRRVQESVSSKVAIEGTEIEASGEEKSEALVLAEKLVEAQRKISQKKKTARNEARHIESLKRLPALPVAVEDGEAREITREIEKNRGLTRKRKKYEGHARVHNRLKYKNKLKKMSGVTMKAQTAASSGDYAGEAAGITVHVNRGKKLR